MKSFDINYDTSEHLLKIDGKGSIDINSFVGLINEIPKYFDDHSRLNVLIDLTLKEICFNEKELKYISEYLLQKLNDNNYMRVALIVAGPVETAMTILFINDIKAVPNLDFKVFSTSTAARNWLNI